MLATDDFEVGADYEYPVIAIVRIKFAQRPDAEKF